MHIVRLQHFRIWLWLVMAFGALAAAGWLTIMVTTVEDHPPLAFFAGSLMRMRAQNVAAPKAFHLISTPTLSGLLTAAGYDENDAPVRPHLEGQFLSILQSGDSFHTYRYLRDKNSQDQKDMDALLSDGQWSKAYFENRIAQSGMTEQKVLAGLKADGFSMAEITAMSDDAPIGVELRADALSQADKGGYLQEFFHIPANRPLTIVLNHLFQRPSYYSCSTTGPVPDDVDFSETDVKQRAQNHQPQAAVSFDPTPLKDHPGFELFTAPASDASYIMECHATADIGHESFTKRQTAISFFIPGSQMTSDGRFLDSDQTFEDKAGKFSDLDPVSGIQLSLNLKGGDNLEFDGGRPVLDSVNYDTTRSIEGGETTSAAWSDLDAEQMRDLLLVIIGTLIALFVTLFIEAIRLVIDGAEMKV